MTERHDFPFQVEVTDPHWIALADGTRIASTLWRPVTANKVPAVVEMIPYRRRDGTVIRDFDIHPYWAGFGIACLRVDIRGAGDSGGLLHDEYLPQEQEDACEIIAQIAAAPWCNGNIGMTGISWGGFNSLQVAARRPPALKAIITLCASDDRYADDIHYMGGALINEQEAWSNFMLVKNAMAPDPQIVGPQWRDMWMQRLAANRSLSNTWLRHQRRDDYWKQGSVCEDFSRITCAVMAVCGWDDSYSNFVPRLLAGLKSPRLGIMGPWSHAFPNRGAPGPHIGYLQEALRWWKHWLADESTGIMDEPMYRAWITAEERPRAFYDPDHAGKWVAEKTWPSARIRPKRYQLNGRALTPHTPRRKSWSRACSPVTAGITCGRWGGYGGTTPDMALDQRREDAIGLTFDMPALKNDMSMLGAPVLEITVKVDQPHAHLIARLCDVYPDGTSALMTYGVLNLSHRDSHEHPTPCPVGRAFKVRLQLNDFGRTVPKGHRIRLSLATQHWPMVWPHAKPVTLDVQSGTSSLLLPVRPDHKSDNAVSFARPETAPACPVTTIAPDSDQRLIEHDVGSGLHRVTLVSDHGTCSIDDRNIVSSSRVTEISEIREGDPLSARTVNTYVWAIKSADADYEAESRTELTADTKHFFLTWSVEAKEQGKCVHRISDTHKIPRDFC